MISLHNSIAHYQKTSSLIGEWKCNLRPFRKLRQTDQLTNQPTDRPGHREVTLPIMAKIEQNK